MNIEPTLLIVDDEPHILSFLHDNFTSDDFTVHTAASVAQARSKLNAHRPHLALLDVNLPDGTGFDLCREVRGADAMDVRFDPDLPIIMLTARDDETDRVRGFQRGADDYVPKPFSYPELLARVTALLRRTRLERSHDVLRVAGLAIDIETHEVRMHDELIPLSSKEFQLLVALARDPRRVFRKHELLKQVWGYQAVGSTRTLDSHASRLRKKLRPHARGRDHIANVWGVGYRLLGNEAEPATSGAGE